VLRDSVSIGKYLSLIDDGAELPHSKLLIKPLVLVQKLSVERFDSNLLSDLAFDGEAV
jgi:hypothetical protein